MAKTDVEVQHELAVEPGALGEATEPSRTTRSVPVASEPVLERVVVRPDAAADEGVQRDVSRPARRGWWQRKFGSD
jgi:hypothetical protein